MKRIERVIVGLTGTETDGSLIQYAAMLGRAGIARDFRFLHVLPSSKSQAVQKDTIRQRIKKEVKEGFLEQSGVEVTCAVAGGPLLDQMLSSAVEQEADLILIGHAPQHTGRRPLARRLAMKAPCSVWMVPDGQPAELDRILVPVDFSEPSADAMRVAISIARQSGASELLALHVYFNESRMLYEESHELLLGEEEADYERMMEKIDTQGVSVEPIFVENSQVGETIDRIAKERDVDLTVMATRGRSNSASILLGSVAEDTIIRARHPVLVVKHFGAQLGFLRALLEKGASDGPQFD